MSSGATEYIVLHRQNRTAMEQSQKNHEMTVELSVAMQVSQAIDESVSPSECMPLQMPH